jgi:hypothetical protein
MSRMPDFAEIAFGPVPRCNTPRTSRTASSGTRILTLIELV